MRVEDSNYANTYDKKVEMPFGSFYFFEKFIISEINEGEHFGWEKVRQLIDISYKHYGKNFKVVYISNRVNSYSQEFQSWIKIRNNGYDFIVAAAMVVYNEISLEIATLEKLFTNYSIKRCFSLEEAVNWAQGLNEFK